MAIRKVQLAFLGHVDHGKTSLLDKIRRSAVTVGEAGGITQAIGVSIIPIETIKKICGSLLDVFKGNLTVPGLLTIDTPGHAAFTSLRKRGGSLADIAILVVDINEGLKPQTIESIEILKANKVPFVIAANKIDLVHGWFEDKNKRLIQNIDSLDQRALVDFETKLYEIVGQVAEHGINADRFDRVSDYTKQVAIVPVSAHTGQGIPELLMVLTGLAQKYLESKLHIDEVGPARGTILEVKESVGLGTTIDTIIYNGQIKVNDTIVIGGIEEPIVTKVRALLEPAPLSEMREKKSKFLHMKQVTAATGVKIASPGLDKAIAGMPIRTATKDTLEQVKKEIQSEVESIITEYDEEGVIIKADTLGGLEALKTLLEEKEVQISSASLGDITKKDILKAQAMKDKDQAFGVILGFNIQVPADVDKKDILIINHDIIYKVIEEYEKFQQKLKEKVELEELSKLVKPCKFLVMSGYIFRQSNPAIVGVDIEVGKIKTGDPVMTEKGRHLTRVKSLKEGTESVSIAEQGKQLAMALDGVTIGRQVNENEFLYTDIPEEDFKKLKKLKKHLSKREIEILKEIAEIKRNNDPVWGVG